ncbi:MAG TPA: DUF6777 domain-containing protein [Acidimicrobiales bacterium]
MVVAILAIAGIVAALILVPGGDDDEASDQVVLEPIDSVQEDDFAGNLDIEGVAQGIDMAVGGLPETQEESTTVLAGRVASGGDPGLYGGSRDSAVCDVDALVNFLTDPANSDKAEAWAGALGIQPGEIAQYIEGLTPVRLRIDTRVTNHGYRDGEATPFQSLLQAGTAVMVDDQGVPRVKCNCGNPLAEPEPLEGESTTSIEEAAQNPDDAWEGMDPANVVTIQPAESAVDSFVMVDPDEGELFERPVGSNGEQDADPINIGDACEQMPESPSCGGTGDEALQLGSGNVQVTLQWGSNADLDLHVTEPDGNEIYFANRGPSSTGGRLDKDSNVGCQLNGSVENVFWPESADPPRGQYTVEVYGYSVGPDGGSHCGGGDYTLTIRIAGEEERIETGTVADDESDTYTFEVR